MDRHVLEGFMGDLGEVFSLEEEMGSKQRT